MRQIKSILISCAALVGFSNPCCYGQYKISGYIETQGQIRTVYLSLLQYDQQTLITENQILFSTRTDPSGYFEFKGQLLSEKDKLYRIHSNINASSGLQLVQDNAKSNYHNFIFSNTDTISFAKSGTRWFALSQNSNAADREWRNLQEFEERLEQDNATIKNKEARQQAAADFAQKVKLRIQRSGTDPLLQLLAFSDLKRRDFDARSDFEKDPKFYDVVANSLKGYYGEASYYMQYQDEISKISNSILQREYALYKKLNYILAFLVLTLSILSSLLFIKLQRLKPKKVLPEASKPALTGQEEKIARLILEDRSNKDIANALFVSLSTVKTHIRNLYAKLDVANRRELAEKLKNHPWD